jgi:hypothetical protein
VGLTRFFIACLSTRILRPSFLWRSFLMSAVSSRRFQVCVTNATAYNSGASSTSHTSTRGDCLTTVSDSDWSIWLQTLSRLLTWTEWPVCWFCKYSLHMDPTENTVLLLMWVTYNMFHCSGAVRLAPDCMATLLPMLSYYFVTSPLSQRRCGYQATALQWQSLLIKLFRLSVDMPQYNEKCLFIAFL